MKIAAIGRGHIGGGLGRRWESAGTRSRCSDATAAMRVGGLDEARALEDFVTTLFAKLPPVFYRFAAPGEL
jgi:hypothetical protein